MADDDHGIVERGDSLRIRVSRRDGAGVRHWRTETIAGTSREAWRRARRRRNRLEEQLEEEVTGRAGAGDARTLSDVFERWLEASAAEVSANTLATNRYNAEHYLGPLTGVDLERLTSSRIAEHYALLAAQGLSGRPLSPHTIRRAHGTLHRALEHAVRWGWLTRNPASVVEPPKIRRIEREMPEPADVSALLALFNKQAPEFALWLQLAAVTGMRRGEICGLRWSDVDLERGQVTVRRAVVIGRKPTGGEYVSVRPSTKTERPRSIAVGRQTVELLESWRRRSEEIAEACGVQLADGYVFAQEADGRDPWHPHRVTTRFMRARARVERSGGVDLAGVRLGDLRHFVASRMLKSGTSVTDTAARLGNSPRTVLSNYAHHIPADDHAVATALEALLAGRG